VTLANPIRYFIVIVKGTYLKNLPTPIILANIWPMAVIGTVTLSSSAWLFRHRME
jgi:ABC-2 type transport system permease protein